MKSLLSRAFASIIAPSAAADLSAIGTGPKATRAVATLINNLNAMMLKSDYPSWPQYKGQALARKREAAQAKKRKAHEARIAAYREEHGRPKPSRQVLRRYYGSGWSRGRDLQAS